MKLLEDNVRDHIHLHVINYLTEEGMNITAVAEFSQAEFKNSVKA